MEFELDLDDLANSESPIVNTQNITTPSNEDDPVVLAVDTNDNNNAPVVENGFDLDLIANLGDEDTSEQEENEEEDGNDIRVSADDTKANNNSSSQNTFTSLASALVEAGTLTNLNEEELKEVTDAPSLLNALQKQVKENEFKDLNDIQKNYLKALELGVPHDTFVHVQANAEQYKKISDELLETRQDLQFELIKRNFLIKGFDLNKADQYAKLALKNEDPLQEAIESREALVAFENSKLEKDLNARELKLQQDREQADIALSKLKSKVIETSEVIPGIKVNSTTRDKIFESMTTPVKVKDKNPLNEVMLKYQDDPEYKMRLHALDVITKGFTDFSKFQKTIKSNALKELENVVNSGTISKSGKSMSTNVASASQIDMAKELKNLEL